MNQEINQTTPPQQPDSGFITNEMISRVTGFFKAPVFEGDAEKTRVSRLLNAVLLAFLLMFVAIPLSTFIFQSENRLLINIGSAIVIAILVSGLLAIRRGVVRRTALIFVTILFLAVVVFAGLMAKGANNLALITLPVVIYLAAYLISPKAGIIFSVLSWIEIIALYFITENAELPLILPTADSSYFTVLPITVLVFALVVAVGSRSYQQSLERATAAELETRKSNEELEGIRSYLQEEVEENTRQLERRTRYLEAAARVAAASIATQNLEEMLINVVNEVSNQFGFYHVGIFMVDEEKQWAALRAASSEGGKQMIARNHRLAVGQQGIVGFVTSLGHGRISQDTGGDRVHVPAEELPDTRSEMALPLMVRDEILGAIDIQDTRPEAFTEDDTIVLQTMADQIALAIENIKLLKQTQETLEEVQRLFGEYSQQAWHETHQKNLLSSYRYFSGAVTRLDKPDELELTGNTVTIPVEVRGVRLGAIEISKGEEGLQWGEDELKLLHSLSEQLGIALDSARLFNESQLRATTEHTISEINSQLWETMDINSILRTTATNLRESLALPELTIRMASPKAETSSNGDLDGDELQVTN